VGNILAEIEVEGEDSEQISIKTDLEKYKASPTVRKLAREMSINLRDV